MIDNILYIEFLPRYVEFLNSDHILHVEEIGKVERDNQIKVFKNNPDYNETSPDSFLYKYTKFETYQSTIGINITVYGILCEKLIVLGSGQVDTRIYFFNNLGNLLDRVTNKSHWRIDNTHKNLKLLDDI